MSNAKIAGTLKESTPWWPPELRAPEGSPNILLVLFDDTGFPISVVTGRRSENRSRIPVSRLVAGGCRGGYR
jgi:hypothetical protein